MRKLEGTQKKKNLITALEGEAFAHMKYEYYASQAKKDGFSDKYLSQLQEIPEDRIRARRMELGMDPVPRAASPRTRSLSPDGGARAFRLCGPS